MAPLRVVLDTNVLVSGLAYPGSTPGLIVTAWRTGGLDVVLSRYILEEVSRVLPRLNRRIQWRPEDVADLVDILSLQADLVEPDTPSETELRDVADLPVLGTLLASRADYLLTGDKDLLTLSGRYPILSPAEFWARYGG